MEEQKKSGKPFYKKWWFICICVVFAIGVVSSMLEGGDSKPVDSSSPADQSTLTSPTESEFETTTESVNDSETLEQKNAVKTAKSYISVSAFSRDGLIAQLEFEGYTSEEATYGADNCGADWMDQAIKSAKTYLSFSAFSHSGLIAQLEFEGYTSEEAAHGADNCEADWMEQAVKSAKTYLSFSSFSRNSLIEQLEYEGFSHEEAVHGVTENGY